MSLRVHTKPCPVLDTGNLREEEALPHPEIATSHGLLAMTNGFSLNVIASAGEALSRT